MGSIRACQFGVGLPRVHLARFLGVVEPFGLQVMDIAAACLADMLENCSFKVAIGAATSRYR